MHHLQVLKIVGQTLQVFVYGILHKIAREETIIIMGLRMEVAACKGGEVPVVDEAAVEVSPQRQCPISKREGEDFQHVYGSAQPRPEEVEGRCREVVDVCIGANQHRRARREPDVCQHEI